jgi:hypothetical protein
MTKQFVKIKLDIHAKWNQHPPMYRVYVNNELFNERNYMWQPSEYITEILQITAEPGEYTVRIENHGGEFTTRKLRCAYGSAEIINNSTFKIIQDKTFTEQIEYINTEKTI